MRQYRRRLPHLDAQGTAVFLTWRLHDSLPAGRHFTNEALNSGEVFQLWDRLLDGATEAPRYLALADNARVVEDLLHLYSGHAYDLHGWCIMSNHVHALLTPHAPLVGILKRLKGASARAIT